MFVLREYTVPSASCVPSGAFAMAYTTRGIRNVGLVGQAGSGKTLLLESLLLQAGATRKERKLQHTLDTAIYGFDHGGIHVNLIDTPGYPDFLGRTFSVLEAVETAALVVSATSGVDTVTERLMEFAQGSRVVPAGDHKQDRLPPCQAGRSVGTSARRVRRAMPAAQSARRRGYRRGRLFFSRPWTARPIFPPSRRLTPGSSTRSSSWTSA